MNRISKNAAIVTAASQDFYPWLLNLIGSIQVNFPVHPPLFVYDLGISKEGIRELNGLRGVRVKKIPPFVPHWQCCYTWKLWVLNNAPADILYFLDAASEVLNPLTEVFQILDNDGYFCVYQKHLSELKRLRDITPPDLLRRLNLPDDFCGERPYFAAGNFGYRKKTPYHRCIREALKLAEEGWTLGWSEGDAYRNHGINLTGVQRACKAFRHDQTLLNILFYKAFRMFKIHDEAKYAGRWSRQEHPGQLVWNSRRDNRDLSYIGKLRGKKRLFGKLRAGRGAQALRSTLTV